jgi:hypothetical protein
MQPMDFAYRVSVDGEDNARWLLGELAGSFIFRSDLPLCRLDASSLYTFEVPCNVLLTFGRFERLLSAIPQVALLSSALPN